MNPVILMVGHIFADESAEMDFIECNDVIEKLSAAASDPSFRDSVLPGWLDLRPLYFQPCRLQEIRNSSIKLRVVVENAQRQPRSPEKPRGVVAASTRRWDDGSR